ncbi:hypothetical protein Pan216_03940 [Planctomycetes bacterium Pan216]|uniref:Uncharacterized protein n=1 Tax=Kolteria novifilia TaxID=2527975 RepID=A0A518AXX9_9BACT|nr:hypothetical protein Pan216_03940 [Planctomycetes bacterium Pan216]
MPKGNTRPPDSTRKRRDDSPEDVKKGNKRMWDAWKQGRELIGEVGMFAGYGAMKEVADGNASIAERLRKYRAMANRISEKELGTICERCRASSRAWGPTFLVELSRLPGRRERNDVAKSAIRDRWGVAELKRRVRLMLDPRKVSTRVGRNRRLDWTSEAEILHEIKRLCVTWIRFKSELEQTDSKQMPIAGSRRLTKPVREEFLTISDHLDRLRSQIGTRLERLRDRDG